VPIGWEPGEGAVLEARPVGVTPDELVELVRAEQALAGQIWTRWRTAEDERVCPECGPLDGQSWPTGEGPEPPLHNHCRCVREFAFVELSSR
jgi:hypothetical protein